MEGTAELLDHDRGGPHLGGPPRSSGTNRKGCVLRGAQRNRFRLGERIMRMCDRQSLGVAEKAVWPRVSRLLPHFAWLAVMLAGCGGSSFSTPTTYEVKGKVILASGKPL